MLSFDDDGTDSANILTAQRIAAMQIGFFDDSGKESAKDSKIVCLAGFMAHRVVWGPFLNWWANLLSHHGLPSIHMKVLMSENFLKKTGWDWQKREAVINDFLACIRDARLTGFGVGIDADYWRSLSDKRRKTFGTAQEFAFQRILRLIADRLDLIKDRNFVEVYFDNDIEFSGSRLNRFNHIRQLFNKVRDRFICISFADSLAYGSLQAADILAWETRLNIIRRSADKTQTPRYKALMSILPQGALGPITGEYWDAESGEELLAITEQTFTSDRDRDA
jgi:Protein of unknown function (DUF3800)